MPLSRIIAGDALRHERSRSIDWQSEAGNDPVAFPERSVLWHFPEPVQWAIYENGINGGPTLVDQYGPSPSEYVVSAIRYGPAGITSASITTVTNKAVRYYLSRAFPLHENEGISRDLQLGGGRTRAARAVATPSHRDPHCRTPLVYLTRLLPIPPLPYPFIAAPGRHL